MLKVGMKRIPVMQKMSSTVLLRTFNVTIRSVKILIETIVQSVSDTNSVQIWHETEHQMRKVPIPLCMIKSLLERM